jgi:hypothetical protein
MKLKACRSIALGAASLVAIAMLAACGRGADTAHPNVEVNRENAEMRTEVPLTRPIALGKAGEVVNVDFELPPPGPNASSALILGFRTESLDSDSGIALTENVLRGGLAAKVRLLRVEEGAVEMVPLSRVTPDLREWVAVPADGSVPGVTVTTPDSTLLEAAGLTSSTFYQKVFKFAVALNAKPGHYRLTVELTSEQPELKNEKAELLVAYSKRGK